MRRKIWAFGAAMALTALMMSGCNTSKSAEEATTEAAEETTTSVDYGAGLNEDGTVAGVNAADYVTDFTYEGIEIPKTEIAVESSEVQSEIESLLSSYSTENEVTDRAVADGDVVNIDYVGHLGTVDGEEFDGGSAEGYDLTIGSGSFIDDFEDQLIGHTPGETVDVAVTFPDDYSSEDLQGQDAVFVVTINYISETVTPEFNDAFVEENLKDSYGYETAKDVKKEIKKNLRLDKETTYIENYILENVTFAEIPTELVDQRLDTMMDALRAQVTAYGYDLESYLSSYGYDDEDSYREANRESCEETVKLFLAADVVAAEQGLSVGEEDLADFFGTDDYSTYTSYYGEPYVKRVVLNRMMVEYIADNATIK